MWHARSSTDITGLATLKLRHKDAGSWVEVTES